MVDDAVAEIMLATQEETIAAALGDDQKGEEKEEKKKQVVAEAPADPQTVAEDSYGISRVLLNSQSQ